MNQASSFVVLAGALALAACASQGPAGSKKPEAGSANAAATTSAAPPKDDGFKPPVDFRRVMMDGQEKFCRKYWPTGSHAESQTECLTEDELKGRMDANRVMLEDSMRTRSGLGTPNGIAPAGSGH